MRGEWFATGDRYERREDGAYVYVGRLDDMLKVGGLWVSPVDMEHVLMEHPRVRGVGVVGVRIEEASRIAAFVELDGAHGDEALAAELRDFCKQHLRRYEYPHVVRFVEELPRTLTAKVQRFALREAIARSPAATPAARAETPRTLEPPSLWPTRIGAAASDWASTSGRTCSASSWKNSRVRGCAGACERPWPRRE
jgi:acyl-coenzyme A synthetase/AMP-(fatty) acid ligase